VDHVGSTPQITGTLCFFLFHMGPFKFESVRRRSSHLLADEGRVYLAPLEVVVQSKKHFRRDRDLAVLPVLEKTLAYFKALAGRVGVPYQTLINMYLRDCAESHRELRMTWRPPERAA